MGILVALYFFLADCQKRGLNVSWGDVTYLHRNCGMVVILFYFLYNYDNLTLKLHQEKRSYPDEGWRFIRRFKVGSVPGISVALETYKKSIKIHHEYDARLLIKSHNCC